ncbi:MAG TPA: uracil-DNA glycosylase [Limnobacter sp.]|uniref:uracil-DNA glycosylase n=1 Tax=Limnobacter sp. TaxID=2003368 RepID=UPI002ED9E7D9
MNAPTNSKAALFDAMGLGPVWELRKPQVASDAVLPPTEPSKPAGLPVDLAALQQQVAQCQACGLCKTRQQTVFSAGVSTASLMVVGEAPGADEDAQGEPFVGRAGQLLDKLLMSMGRNRQSNVYIANVLKCRPPGNRNPEADEIAQCEPYLRQQLALVQPKVLLLVGRFAISTLLNTDKPISQLRGQVHSVNIQGQEVPAVVSYHPAYLLRRPEEKAKSWDDLLLLKRVMAEHNA